MILLELMSLALYVVQQAGVMLGVGSEVVLMLAYLYGLRAPSDAHSVYVRAARFAQRLGLGLMIISGAGAVALHYSLGQAAVLASAAFIGKWILIGIVLVGYKLERTVEERGVVTQSVVRGIVGGNWLALFLLHSLAPDMPAVVIATGYVVWMVGFSFFWALFVAIMHHTPAPKVTKPVVKKVAPVVGMAIRPKVEKPIEKPVPKVVQAPVVVAIEPTPAPVMPAPAPVVPKVVAPAMAPMPPKSPASAPKPAPVVVSIPIAPAPRPFKPSPAPPPPAVMMPDQAPFAPVVSAETEKSDLQKIRIMPRTPEDMVKFA